jgi:hypothetical protein
MIDLNLQLDYKSEPYQIVRKSKIYTLDEKGLENYYSKDHITHKFLSKFHPKIMEHIKNKLFLDSFPSQEQKKISRNRKCTDLPKIQTAEKKKNSNFTKRDFSNSEVFNENMSSLKISFNQSGEIKISRPSPASLIVNKNSEQNSTIKNENISKFRKSEFPKMNEFFRLSNTNYYKGFDQSSENIRLVSLNENLRLLNIFNQFKVPIDQRKHYKIDVKVNKPKYV